jgi:xylose isomerase
MRMYLMLKQRAAAYRADPDVRQALADSGVHSLNKPTMSVGESVADLLADHSAYEQFDPDVAGARGYGFVHLNQLAIEHILGAR